MLKWYSILNKRLCVRFFFDVLFIFLDQTNAELFISENAMYFTPAKSLNQEKKKQKVEIWALCSLLTNFGTALVYSYNGHALI